jgi:hypothetical protein
MFKLREKKLGGNTVYDVAIPADVDNVFIQTGDVDEEKRCVADRHVGRYSITHTSERGTYTCMLTAEGGTGR